MNAAVIPADIEINDKIVARIVDEQFNLPLKSVVLLGEGFDNAVYLVNEKWVFRLPRRTEAIELIATEIRLLPLLSPHLSLAIPKPAFIGAPSPLFPRPFYGHAIIEGQPGSAVDFAKDDYRQIAIDLATFISKLHSLTLDHLGLSSKKFPPVFDRADFHKLKANLDQRLMTVSAAYQLDAYQAKFDKITDDAKSYESSPQHDVVIHGDMYHRHLIFDHRKRLCGVIDWGDCAIGDAVSDLGVVYQFLPRDARDDFFAIYGHVDDATRHYARFLGLYYAIALLWFGHDRNDKDLIRTSLSTFEEL